MSIYQFVFTGIYYLLISTIALMIKELFYILSCVFLFLAVLADIMYLASPKKAASTGFIMAIAPKKYTLPANWRGTPVDNKGRFVNAQYPYYQNYLKILPWIPGHALNLVREKAKRFPVIAHSDDSFLQGENSIIWLGHASFFLRINKLNILIDPHFYNTFPYKRHSVAPIPEKLFTKIDYILISHDHADHCDKRSLKALMEQNPAATILTGLGMDTLLRTFTNTQPQIKMAEWYQQYDIPAAVTIHFVPSRHYCNRIGQQYNARLWGGFIIKYKAGDGYKTIYFEGDSAYGDHFKDIQALFNPDIAIMGVGAYMPKWMMSQVHMDPVITLQAARELKVKTLIPMHCNTFNLSNERMDAPVQTLQANSIHYPDINIATLTIGEILDI